MKKGLQHPNRKPEAKFNVNGRVTVSKRGRAKGPLSDKLITARIALIEVQKENADLEKRRREMEVAESEGRLVERERVVAFWDGLVAQIKGRLDASFRVELPAKLGGCPADQIALENGNRLNEIYALLSNAVP